MIIFLENGKDVMKSDAIQCTHTKQAHGIEW